VVLLVTIVTETEAAKLFPAPAPASFEMLVMLVDKVVRTETALYPAAATQTPMTKLLLSLPQSFKDQFSKSFDNSLIQMFAAATDDREDVEVAIHRAHEFVSSGSIGGLVDCLQANQTSNCNVEEAIRHAAVALMNQHGWNVTHSEVIAHGSRPLASETPIPGITATAIGALFWAAYAMAHIFRMGDIQQLARDSLASDPVAVAQERKVAEQEKWMLITSAFPTFDKWRDDVGNSPHFRKLVQTMCSDIRESNGEASEDMLQSCWETKRLMLEHENDKWTKYRMLPGAFATFFAMAMLIKDGSVITHCRHLHVANSYRCTNGAYKNSVCTMVCENDQDTDGKVLFYRTIPDNVSTMMVCAANGNWIGGPFNCLSKDPAKDVPYISGTNQFR